MMVTQQQYNNLIDLIIKQSERYQNKAAFRFFLNEDLATRILDYQQLLTNILELATHLQRFISLGDRIVLILPPGENYIISLLACFFAGAVAVPIYPPDTHKLDISLEIFKTIINDSAAKVVLTTDKFKAIYLNSYKQQNFANELMWLNINDFKAYARDWVKPSLHENSLAILLYTSGSTGEPKGVMLSHKNLIHDAAIMSEHCKINENDIFAIWLPPYHVSGIFSGIILPLYAGAETILFSPQQFLEKPQRWVEIISIYRVTMSGAPTFAYNLCANSIEIEKEKNLDLTCWRVAVIGGEPIYQTVIEKFIKRFSQYGFNSKAFYSMYGLTESTMISTGSQLGEEPSGLWISRDGLEQHQANLVHIPDEDSSYYVNSGQALNSITLKVVNTTTLEECKDREIGEIWLSGASVAQGYWNNPKATQYAFQAFTNNNEGPYLRTGDLGFLYQKNLYVTGRLKEMIIIRGINYYPNDIELSATQSHPLLTHTVCAAFAIEINNEEKLILTLEIEQNLSLTIQENLYEQVRGNIARRHGIQLYGIVFVNKGCTPRTATSKVQRNACKAKVACNEWKVFQPIIAHTYSNLSAHAAKNIPTLNKEILIAMTSNQAKLELHKLLQAVFSELCGLPPSAIAISKPIANFGIDSVIMVKIITYLHNQHEIEVPINCFYDETTIETLTDKIWSQWTQRNTISLAFNTTDFNQEIQLSNSIKPILDVTRNFKQNYAILLTGATGFLGAYLLHDLLQNTSASIYCLIRADNKEQAKQRLIVNLCKRFEWHTKFDQRINTIIGELDKPNLGIEATEYEFLAQTIDQIIHNGASVNFVAPYHTLKSTNVNSVVEVLKLASHSKLKSVNFISTLGVFNSKDRENYDELKETDRLTVPENIFGGYAQSKWVAEELLIQAQQRGIPITIYRPGLITGDSANGYMNTEDFLCRFLKGCIELKAFPNLDIPIDMTPVDFVSAAVTYLSQHDKHMNNIYHLTCPKPITLPRFAKWIKEYGYDIDLVSYQDWLALIMKISTTNPLYTLIPFLTNRLTSYKTTFLELFALTNNPSFSQTNTQIALKDTHIKCAQIDDNLLRIYFDYFHSINYLNQPQNKVKELAHENG